jgi:hypothetical protein
MTRSAGMHEQMIATLISMLDQWMTSAWSQVGFKEFPKLMRDCRRNADTTVTLGMGVSMLGEMGFCNTYKVPTRNIIATPILLRHDNWRWKTSYNGRINIQMSKAMLMIAFDQAIPLILQHFPVASPSQWV